MSCRNHVTNHLMVDNNKEREVINRTENKKNNTEIILDLAGDDNAAAGCEPNKGARPQIFSQGVEEKYDLERFRGRWDSEEGFNRRLEWNFDGAGPQGSN